MLTFLALSYDLKQEGNGDFALKPDFYIFQHK